MRFPSFPVLSKAERAVLEFNLEHPVGTMVRYWLMEKKGSPDGAARTRTVATLYEGHSAVLWIEEVRGCVALSHIEVVPEEALQTGPKTEIVYYGVASD